MKLLKPLISTGLTIFLVSYLLPTVSFSDNWVTLVLAAIVLTLLQKIIKPILKILFLPVNVITLGLFSLVINVTVLWLATYLVPGFRIENMILFDQHLNHFFSLLVVSFVLGVTQSVVGIFL
jgi:putative membrane protein